MSANVKLLARRVVIGLEPAMLDAATLAAAAQLARSAGAELAALFVEDDKLLRLANLPFALEIGAASASRRRVEAADIERALKVQAAQLKRALAAAAQRLELQWTFEVLRGQALSLLLECAGATDIVVLAGSAKPPPWQPTLEALLSSALSLERVASGCVAVALGGGPEALRVLPAACALAQASAAELVLLIAESEARDGEVLARAEAWLTEHGATARVALFPGHGPALIAEVLARERARVLFWPGTDDDWRGVEIAEVVGAISCPLIVVK